MLAVIMLMAWLFIGGYNMLVAENISKLAFFSCWITLLFCIIALSVK